MGVVVDNVCWALTRPGESCLEYCGSEPQTDWKATTQLASQSEVRSAHSRKSSSAHSRKSTCVRPHKRTPEHMGLETRMRCSSSECFIVVTLHVTHKLRHRLVPSPARA
eukprot:2256268-Pleurochrysis_carterae.AAC.1